MKKKLLVSFAVIGALAGCNMPFDTSPNTPSSKKKTVVPTDVVADRPAPSSPFMGHRFFFDGALPEGWYVSARGDDQPLAPGYAALCVLSRAKSRDKVLILLASSVDAAARAEVTARMRDAEWWQPRIPLSFFDADRVGADVGLHVTKGQFADIDSLLLFAVLRCQRESCEASLEQTREIANRLQLRPARADDEHVVSPSGGDCGSRF